MHRRRYRAEMENIMARWRRLGSMLTENAQRIQELMAKLMQFEVRLEREREKERETGGSLRVS